MNKPEYYVLVFFTTHETLYAEKMLKQNKIPYDIIPKPEKVATECGIAIEIAQAQKEKVRKVLQAEEVTPRVIFAVTSGRLEENSFIARGGGTLKRIYLDHNATTPIHPLVTEAMLPYYQNIYGNASSIHSFGREARAAVDQAREKVALLIGAEPSEIVFTSGGTESDNMAIKGIAYAQRTRGKHIITSQIEHHAVFNCCKYLEKEGFKISYLPVDEYGVVNPEEVRAALTDETILITIMHANNEIGTIEPITAISHLARERNICFHTDAVQSVGKIPVKVKELGIDLLSLSAHKIYGPKGTGVLFIRKGTKMVSLLHGGHHEKWRRAGTENVPGIVGLGKAAELATENLDNEYSHMESLRTRLKEGIIQQVEDITVIGHPEDCLPNTLNVCFKYIEGESLILNLDMKGIAVSTGSACTSGSLEPSHVLMAIGIPPAVAQGSIRFSLGRENTEEEIDYLLNVLPEIVKRLRAMSPLYEKNR